MPWVMKLDSEQADKTKPAIVNIPDLLVNKMLLSLLFIVKNGVSSGARPCAAASWSSLRLGLVIALAASAFNIALPGHSAAQTLRDRPAGGILDQAIRDRLEKRATGATDTNIPVVSPIDTVRPKANVRTGNQAAGTTASRPVAGSRLESDYAARLKQRAPQFSATPPVQFGYRVLGKLAPIDLGSTGGAINGSYRLGIGDELVVSFRGQINNSYRTRIDREGQVVLPDMPPLPAAGLSFRRFQTQLARRTKALFANTEAFASLGRVRNFPIMVLGHVNQPGVHRISGVATMLDALIAAGGVQGGGSLRDVRLIRGSRTIAVDLYDLLLTGRLRGNITLREGDRVFVPSIGDTIAVAGDVQRPGIYELAKNTPRPTVAQALAQAGRTLRPSGYRYLIVSDEDKGGDSVREITDLRRTTVGPGDILLIAKRSYGWMGAFYLDGHVSVPGPRSLTGDRSIGEVVAAQDVFARDPYTLIAVIERTDPKTRARHFLAVDMDRILARRLDSKLRPEDTLIVLGMDDIRFLSSERVQSVLDGRGERTDSIAPSANRAAGPCIGLRSLAEVVSRSRSDRFSGARIPLNPERNRAVPVGAACPAIFDRHPALLPFVLDFAVAVTGEARSPGVYPVAGRTALGSLIAVVGGLAVEADLTQIEITRFNAAAHNGGSTPVRQIVNGLKGSLTRMAVAPGDIVRFNPRFSDRDIGSVFLSGEFKRPGVYSIRRGEKFSDLVARAGGLTEQSYALGAVFTRVRVRQQEKKDFERAARDLQSGLAEALSTTTRRSSDPSALVLAVKELATTLRNTKPVGRVVVEADPTVLSVRPELDTVLEAGDRIHVPKRPNHVAVSGEVLNPGAIQFAAGRSVDEYVAAAGDVTRVADDGRIFVVMPNGSARPVSASSWNFTSVQIPPGSTIVVPRDPKPFDLMAFTVAVADIVSKLAITGASLAVIGAN